MGRGARSAAFLRVKEPKKTGSRSVVKDSKTHWLIDMKTAKEFG
jgi:hypothetical protein